MDIVGICPLLASKDGHVLQEPLRTMDMSCRSVWVQRTCPSQPPLDRRTCPALQLGDGHSGYMSTPGVKGWTCPAAALANNGHVPPARPRSRKRRNTPEKCRRAGSDRSEPALCMRCRVLRA